MNFKGGLRLRFHKKNKAAFLNTYCRISRKIMYLIVYLTLKHIKYMD